MASECKGVYFEEDRQGWAFAKCMCGWTSAPVPGVEDAADSWGDHLVGPLRNAIEAVLVGDECGPQDRLILEAVI